MRTGDEQISGWGTGAHPLVGAATALHRVLDQAHAALATGSDPSWLPAQAQSRLLEDLARAQERLTALTMRTLAAADGPSGVTSLTGARSAADWLADRLHVRPGRLAVSARLAAAIADRPLLSAALAAGEVTVEHARAVVDVWETLPTDALDDETLAKAEQTLVSYCGQFTPPEVRRLGRRLLEVVAPDQADELEARRLADEERAAREKTTLRLRRTAHGTRRITGEIPELHATILDARAPGDREPEARRQQVRIGRGGPGPGAADGASVLRADRAPAHRRPSDPRPRAGDCRGHRRGE